MRRKEKQIIDPREIDSIIQKAKFCRIGMSLDNVPYIVPMSFGFRDYKIFVHSAREGKKIEILKKNNHVCFEMDIEQKVVESDVACNWGVEFYSIIGQGFAHFIKEKKEKIEALKAIMSHYTNEDKWIFEDSIFNKTVVIRIQIENLSAKKSGYLERSLI